MLKLLWIYLIVINCITCIMYGMDKRKAKKGAWRIPESTLIGLAFAGGSIGAMAGMRLFHHKTKKAKFLILVPLAFLLYAAIITYVLTR